jgi:hypothetical protein
MENVRRLREPQQGFSERLFPLTQNVQVVDSMTGREVLYFLDAYSRYHQITMRPLNHLATSFITL